ncbi:glycoside hydrolase family 99-like domain-containing protein [Olsenella sp. YH-ols2217]|uniref:Glycoside hydrolase family 99-like domain-containing protein n=1 Tax=Kribbibacterium absianum TaxID=3044210 RepID=A0ABT6ZM91_9ACTN|nr:MULTISPECIES: glycoside hydrolase family 99-like domain-containing protein [unclassified Olsenella]MDJ1122162.1 glycoside hydrolase family 99-like domain-containing protein [Olsenella sp. YH-ols2216]MDJ1130170.1 glycoside hydrolase family 99-like domain-containing protein [Olsenella sp. YH-ols2217]
MKVIAFYLPQFHTIPENDEWWGKDFTEWVNVRKAEPLFEGHQQPRVPKGENYYNLLNPQVQAWQAQLAREAGVYGFCYYHYWFNGKLLLEKPMENMLADPSIDIPFCISWANEAWTKAWVNENQVLIPQHYGQKKEWKEHFDYLLPFFQDPRYIKNDNRPLLIIYRPEVIGCLNEMLDYWQELAREAGFDGLYLGHQYAGLDLIDGADDSRFQFDIEFQPIYGRFPKVAPGIKSKLFNAAAQVKRKTFAAYEKATGVDLDRKIGNRAERSTGPEQYSYDEVWERILTSDPVSPKSVPGGFVAWDNTPRKGRNGTVSVGACPERFREYMARQIERAKDVYHSDYIFLTAWNEWAEGSYLEPDETFGDGYLRALESALEETGEMPQGYGRKEEQA